MFILANVDGSILFKYTKTNYSSVRKEESSNWSTIPFSLFISIVSVILSNGVSILWIRKETINIDIFSEYLEHLSIVCEGF